MFTAGHIALVRACYCDAIAPQSGQIALGRGMLPHAHIHRRGNHHWRIRGQQQSRGQIIGQSPRHLGHQIRSGRGDNNQIGNTAQLDMAHLGLVTEVK